MSCISEIGKFVKSIEYIKLPCLFIFAAIVGMNLSLLYCLLKGWKNVMIWGIETMLFGAIGIFFAWKKKLSWEHLVLLWSTIDAFFSMCLRSCTIIYFSMNPYMLCEILNARNVISCSLNTQKFFFIIVAASNVYSIFQLCGCLLMFNNIISIRPSERTEPEFNFDLEKGVAFASDSEFPEKSICI
ncbi:Schizosaccharomyces specific protein Meu31 [Schizosaccharomyces pombe]|uniref:Meiotic expression up-regulated protein 31 n=1 Tax=Schizosaccharomyces pombe (strain 972 / ATCC 24843) TaxID=284812 RepID=MEU31_SCHPO|nr:protein meu31 [Schizosaccharomyces pombe]Q9Y826.1 RecName: Full=Meiotic expression up-regulated protein 31 [Schizosaccharomyces pombe 972h-]CAB16356.2 sequence orphan Meu31 [Schizosaccharomyces pombe]|eukprot:NP_593198.1 protein meu31 [Schizosaccharomyces pombe]